MALRAKRYPLKSSVLHVRIQPTTLTELKKSAAASGRTVSSEAEHQLHRALADMGGGVASRTHVVMTMIAKAIDGFVGLGSPYAKDKRYKRRQWLDDPYSFDQAARLVVAALEMLRPQGEPSPPEGEPLGERSPLSAIESTLREIRTADPSVPFGKQTPNQRWLTLMRQDLGPLADRPVIWGFTADEERKQDALAKPFLDEYIPLTRKKNKTPADEQRIADLEQKIREIVVVRKIP
jgi:hypothetical protein